MYQYLYSLLMLNLIEVIGTLVVVIFGLWMYKRGNKSFVHKIILALVTEAEKKYGSGTGELKYNHVVERIYEVLPFILRILFTRNQIDKMVEDAVEYLKRYLMDGKDLIGY